MTTKKRRGKQKISFTITKDLLENLGLLKKKIKRKRKQYKRKKKEVKESYPIGAPKSDSSHMRGFGSGNSFQQTSNLQSENLRLKNHALESQEVGLKGVRELTEKQKEEEEKLKKIEEDTKDAFEYLLEQQLEQQKPHSRFGSNERLARNLNVGFDLEDNIDVTPSGGSDNFPIEGSAVQTPFNPSNSNGAETASMGKLDRMLNSTKLKTAQDFGNHLLNVFRSSRKTPALDLKRYPLPEFAPDPDEPDYEPSDDEFQDATEEKPKLEEPKHKLKRSYKDERKKIAEEIQTYGYEAPDTGRKKTLKEALELAKAKNDYKLKGGKDENVFKSNSRRGVLNAIKNL